MLEKRSAEGKRRYRVSGKEEGRYSTGILSPLCQQDPLHSQSSVCSQVPRSHLFSTSPQTPKPHPRLISFPVAPMLWTDLCCCHHVLLDLAILISGPLPQWHMSSEVETEAFHLYVCIALHTVGAQ